MKWVLPVMAVHDRTHPARLVKGCDFSGAQRRDNRHHDAKSSVNDLGDRDLEKVTCAGIYQ